MKRIITFLALILICFLVYGSDTVRPSRVKYINDHKEIAVTEMLKSGVPASITLAQACLESMDGGSPLAKEANNHFGIKCSDWKGPGYIQDDDTKDECFRKYNSILESYSDHSNFLKTRPRYAQLFELDITDYKSWAKGLKKAGYATDPAYADRLIKIIETNKLFLLDQRKEAVYTASVNSEPEGPENPGGRKTIYVPSVNAVDAFSMRKVHINNGIEYIIVKNGDNLKSLAKELQLGYWQLPKYNELGSNSEVTAGQIIYIEPKKNEAAVPVYTVKPGDTILSIAQENGIKSKYIYKYNGLQEGARVEPGQQLFLKKSNPSKS